MWGTIESRVGYDGGPGIPHFVVLADDWPVSYCQAQFQLASLMPVELRLALSVVGGSLGWHWIEEVHPTRANISGI